MTHSCACKAPGAAAVLLVSWLTCYGDLLVPIPVKKHEGLLQDLFFIYRLCQQQLPAGTQQIGQFASCYYNTAVLGPESLSMRAGKHTP